MRSSLIAPSTSPVSRSAWPSAFRAGKARGAAAVDAVAAMLTDPSPYMRGRAIHLLYQLGPEGRRRAGLPSSYVDSTMRIAASDI